MTDRFAYEMPNPPTLGPGRSGPGTGTQPVTDRFGYELPPQIRTQLVPDRLMDDPLDKLKPGRNYMYDSHGPPEADLMDTVAHLQLEVATLKSVQSEPSM